MDERLTKPAGKVVGLAREEAQLLGSTNIGDRAPPARAFA